MDGTFAGICYVPAVPSRRLVMMLHGAGGSAEAGLQLLLPYADEYGLLLNGPQSAAVTWDVILGGYGPDVHPDPIGNPAVALYTLGGGRLPTPDLERWANGEPAWESPPLLARLRQPQQPAQLREPERMRVQGGRR